MTSCEELGRRVASRELGYLVEVLKVQAPQDRVHGLERPPDVDHDPVGVELAATEFDIDHVGGAVQALGRAEHGTVEAVRDHEMVAD